MKTQKTIIEIENEYELEIDKIIKTIKKQKSKKVLLQFPEGLKPYSTIIHDKILEELRKQDHKNNTQLFIWLDTCFGACDIPLEVEKLGVDLIIQFGHSAWDFSREDIHVLR